MTMSPAILEAIAIGNLPDVEWKIGDDLCDCVYQRIGMWKNPYLAETHEIRLCCLFGELRQMFPQYFRDIPGYFDDNTQEWITEPWRWNGEDDMPHALWVRQLAKVMNVPLSEARKVDVPAPKGIKRQPRPSFFLRWGGEWLEATLGG